MSHGVLPNEVAEGTRGGMAPLAKRLHGLGVTANGVTVLGLLITLAGSALLAADRTLPAFAVLLVGTLSDTLDGALARVAGGGTRFGEFLDSTADRISDAAMAAAVVALGATRGDAVLLWGGLVGLVASFMVSYARAKAESLGVKATVGVAPREARLVLFLSGLGLSAVLGASWLFVAAVVAVALLSTLTLLQRVAHVARALR